MSGDVSNPERKMFCSRYQTLVFMFFLFVLLLRSKRSEKTEFNQIAVINYYHSKIASTVQVQLEREHNESLHFFLQAIYLQWTLLLHLSNQEI